VAYCLDKPGLALIQRLTTRLTLRHSLAMGLCQLDLLRLSGQRS